MPSININGKLLDFSSPKIMGILNVTPDSFFDGGNYQQEETIIGRARKMWEEGAAIIDIGGYSSRPGASEVSEEEETVRVCRAVTAIKQELPDAILSVDTFRASVARQAIEAGAHIINDISGGQLDGAMFETVAALQAPYIMMHTKGSPQNMASLSNYENLLEEILDFFHPRIAQLRSMGVKDVIVDPGFGFAKDLEQNYVLLRELGQFGLLDCPILVGISRKSMIYKLLGTSPQEALNGTTALHIMALERGANILRVHDVVPAMEAVQLYQQLYSAKA